MNSGDIPDSMKSALSRGIDGASPGTGARIIPGAPYVKEKTPGPNDPCPCGSGKKYKKCCGAKGSREGEG